MNPWLDVLKLAKTNKLRLYEFYKVFTERLLEDHWMFTIMRWK